MRPNKAVGALLGAAYGDALGWPNTRAVRLSPADPSAVRPPELVKWTRKAGGRFHLHDETITPGQHSDDVRLTLAATRAVLSGGSWSERLTRVELPLWTAYERGEGGAARKAAEAWLDGLPPWSSARKPRHALGYYDSNGDGAARRVIPQVAATAGLEFKETAARIISDAIATHGHPRAILGALAFGYALWRAFRQETTLGYGRLVEELIEVADVWAAPPRTGILPYEWLERAKIHLPDHERLWSVASSEIIERLEIVKAELGQGALCVDAEVLSRLQRLDTRLAGAGGTAAVSAVYLASRHAHDPGEGVVAGAGARIVDTSALASMTGALLGALHGDDWLAPIRPSLEDADYIQTLAEALAGMPEDPPTSPVEPLGRVEVARWAEAVGSLQDGETIPMPDGRSAKATGCGFTIGGGGAFKVEFRKLLANDGQTIHINTFVKGDFRSKIEAGQGEGGFSDRYQKRPDDRWSGPRHPDERYRQDQRPEDRQPAAPYGRRQPEPQAAQPGKGRRSTDRTGCGQKIISDSLERAVWFYRDRLGLAVKRQTPSIVVFEQGLVIVPVSYAEDFVKHLPVRNLIYVKTSSIEERYVQIEANGLEIVTGLAEWGKSGTKYFRCLDPDGDIVEVFAAE